MEEGCFETTTVLKYADPQDISRRLVRLKQSHMVSVRPLGGVGGGVSSLSVYCFFKTFVRSLAQWDC